jgi:hypothetical protein
MNKEHKSKKAKEQKCRMGFSPCWSALCTVIIFILSGCGEMKKPLPICPGKSSVTEALAALQSQSENMIPLFSNKGNFSIEYYDKDEMRKQHLNIRILLIKPPSEIYMQAAAGMVEKAVVLGSNEKEFWFENKVESAFYWGLWSQQNADMEILINPQTFLEAIGITKIDANADWSLSNEGAYDVLTKTVQGIISKKLYIYCCDYRVRKIEYYDSQGKPLAVVELDKYKEVSPGFFIPFSIAVNSITQNVEDTLNLEIKLDSIKAATEKQKNFKIIRQKPEGFDHIYQIINGREIPQ